MEPECMSDGPSWPIKQKTEYSHKYMNKLDEVYAELDASQVSIDSYLCG